MPAGDDDDILEDESVDDQNQSYNYPIEQFK